MNPAWNALRTPLLLAGLMVFPPRFDDPTHPRPFHPLPPSGVSADEEDVHAEMRRVFRGVERSLKEIDRLLSNASSGKFSTSAADKESTEGTAGIDKLLSASELHGRAVLDGIDRILELANHSHPTGAT